MFHFLSAHQHRNVPLSVSTSAQKCPTFCQHISTVMSHCQHISTVMSHFLSAHQHSNVPMPRTSPFIRIIPTASHYQNHIKTDNKRQLLNPTLLSLSLCRCTVIVFRTLATDLRSITAVTKVWSADPEGSASNCYGIRGYVSFVATATFIVLN